MRSTAFRLDKNRPAVIIRLPAWRIGQRWGATRAPLQAAIPMEGPSILGGLSFPSPSGSLKSGKPQGVWGTASPMKNGHFRPGLYMNITS